MAKVIIPDYIFEMQVELMELNSIENPDEETKMKIRALRERIRKAKKYRQEFNYRNTGGHNGPTGHGDVCMSDADPGL